MDADPLELFADLLEYPTPRLADQAEACIESLKPVLPEAAERLSGFRSGVRQRSQARMEELYTTTFDLQPVCYPYVGYHLFGESYKRGAFMAKLVEGYRAGGFDPGRELPDHIAVILRFLALGAETRKGDFGRALLLEGLLPALEKMTRALEGQAAIPYGAVLQSLSLFLAEVKEKEMIHA